MQIEVLPGFAGRILTFDTRRHCDARRCMFRRAAPERDAMIAATALVAWLDVVTRNVGDFEQMGVPLVNPWEARCAMT